MLFPVHQRMGIALKIELPIRKGCVSHCLSSLGICLFRRHGFHITHQDSEHPMSAPLSHAKLATAFKRAPHQFDAPSVPKCNALIGLLAVIGMSCFSSRMQTPPKRSRLCQMPTVNHKSTVIEPVMVGDTALVMSHTKIPSLVSAMNAPRHPKIIFRPRPVKRWRP